MVELVRVVLPAGYSALAIEDAATSAGVTGGSKAQKLHEWRSEVAALQVSGGRGGGGERIELSPPSPLCAASAGGLVC